MARVPLRRAWVSAVLAVVLLLSGGMSGAKSLRTVRFVPDGDTVVMENGQTVRLIGINAPEADTPRGPAEPFGEQAGAALRKMVQGRAVVLETDQQTTDRYGRFLACVILPDGTMANERMVRAGLAWCVYTAPNGKYTRRLLAAQRAAMDEKAGLWAVLPDLPGPFIGNRRSLRLHHPSCPFVGGMSKKNREMFPSLKPAFRQGYAPCEKCLHGRVMRSIEQNQGKKTGEKAEALFPDNRLVDGALAVIPLRTWPPR
ncbi:MAG: thermonuclease family protein [Deltaproteobacteria bacterium]|nr:thermonuclease family protein [Deltaproteobacteria bacterium]